MTTEEKARAYDEALERAKKLSIDGYLDAIAVEEIFPPEESEDERIRNVIYKLLLGMREEIFTAQDEIVTKEKALAYLEKKPDIKIWPHPIKDAYLEQKEQKPELVQHPPITFTFNSNASRDERPIAWSDEDEDYVNAIIAIINRETALYPKGGATEELNNDLIAWLKRLRPQPSWKPSDQDELMKLKYAGTSTKLD